MFPRKVINKNIGDELEVKHLEVPVVSGNFEDAFRKFKITVQDDGIITLFKTKQAYEKPSEKKRRKRREAQERQFLIENREALMLSGEWDKRQKRKEQKRQVKMEKRRKQADQNG